MIESHTIKETKPGASQPDLAKVAGRGTIYITASKIWFMVSGYGIHFTLPRLMSTEQFGIYQVVISVVSIINAVIVTGTYQTVSKYTSQEEEKADSIKSKALKLQLLVGGGIASAFALLAPVISNYLNDERLINPLRLAALITLSYSFYAVFTGYFNGQRKFFTQSVLDIAYSTLKLGFIVLFVWLGYGVAGGVGGFALAAVAVLGLAALAAGKGNRAGEVRAADLLKFQAYLLLFTFALNLLQKVDIILIKALSSADATQASENAAYYGAAINLANITYQIIISVTFVIFPLVSQSTFAEDRARTRSYISTTLRYTLIVMALVATLFSANSSEVLRVIYPAAYQAGSGALSIVAYGMLLFGLLYVLTTIISASGRPRVSLFVGSGTLAASGLLNALLIPAYGIEGAAIATTASMGIGAIAASLFLWKNFGALVPFNSVARIGAAALLIYAASYAQTFNSVPLIILKLTVLSLIYAAALVLMREIWLDDLSAVKRVIRK